MPRGEARWLKVVYGFDGALRMFTLVGTRLSTAGADFAMWAVCHGDNISMRALPWCVTVSPWMVSTVTLEG